MSFWLAYLRIAECGIVIKLQGITNLDKKQEERMGIKVALHNLGCKVNAYEVEAMQQLLEEAGYDIVTFEP